MSEEGSDGITAEEQERIDAEDLGYSFEDDDDDHHNGKHGKHKVSWLCAVLCVVSLGVWLGDLYLTLSYANKT